MSDEKVTFESVLYDQTLNGERLRLAVVSAFAGIAYLFFMLLYAVAPKVLESLFLDKFSPLWASVLAAAIVAGELVFRRLILLVQRSGRRPFRPVPYFSALVEISIPTVIVVFLSTIFGPAYALVTPPVLLYGVFIILSALRLSYRLCFFTGLVAGIEYIAVSAYLLSGYAGGQVSPILTSVGSHVAKGLIFVAMGGMAGLLTIQIRRGIRRSYESMEERNRVVGVFGQHVSPEVVDALLTTDIELGGRLQPVCLMFLDIRNFTAHSEKSDPIEVVRFLNALFDFMVESVNRHGGIINKFLGDGFMAVFGAPIADDRKSQNALDASLDILDRLVRFNVGREQDPVRIGIGLHSGEAVTGNVGSLNRREYTIIGDVVNVASRIEQLNKSYGSSLLLSESVVRELDSPDGAELVGPVGVKGHEAPVVIFRMA